MVNWSASSRPEEQGLGKAGLLDGMDKNDMMRIAELGVLADRRPADPAVRGPSVPEEPR